ncbi:LON peptidase substrate-binding domain-containing protein [Aquimarina brevivitae]|uniref:Lon N-terminal domain-containing protein n=1 Tax=Aquimarina brevivitae TaxID=323412 RepID=A0A4V2F7M3_9FLAO|nr:LON peptidase substrate-binding domain-containing protein [Aquimarina brevivitae]RZT00320.1 hypothetical protein EV197_1556 [Aquimarina brevivitae]
MLPLFPLQLVVYPKEELALHIFEDRYKQLIFDCNDKGIHFGIPTFLNKRLDYGTEVYLDKVVKEYPDGKCDIICKGIRVFQIVDFHHQYPNKGYAGAEVNFFEDDLVTDLDLQEELLNYIAKLYVELAIEKPPIFKRPVLSYQVAHKIGLSFEQEYHLLKIRNEKERLAYLIGHLKGTIPVVKEMNRAKKVIQMNGHFKNLDPLDLKDFKI